MKKILIADDKAEIRSLVEITLDLGEFEFFQADNGLAALEATRKVHPDLVILDVMMPGELDGYGVCDAIKKDPATQDIRVLMLTARGQEADQQQGSAAGADDYFIKPFSPRELLDKVCHVLNI